jgi:hypothetical protein
MSLGQSLYWANGMFLYTAPLVFQTLLFAAILWRSRLAAPQGWPTQVWIGLVAFLSAGFSEPALGLQAAILLMAVLARPNVGLRLPRASLWAAGLATAASGVIQLLSPSIAERQAAWAVTCGPANVLERALLVGPVSAVRLFLCQTIVVAVLIAAGILLGWQRSAANSAANMDAKAVFRRLLLVGLAAWALTAAAALPAAYAQCAPPNSRSHIVLHFSMVIGLLACGFVLGDSARPGLRFTTVVVAAATLLFVGAGMRSVFHIVVQSGGAARYAAAWDARDQQLRAAARAFIEDVTVQPLPEEGSVVQGLEVPGRNPMKLWNLAAGQYYGICRLRVTEDLPGVIIPEPWTKERCVGLYFWLSEIGKR